MDGKTILSVNFYPKAGDKVQVTAQHSKIPDAKSAANLKKSWAEALDRLKEMLE